MYQDQAVHPLGASRGPFALAAAWSREQTEKFKQEYAKRAGVEGVHAQGVRRMGLRRSRYIGEPRPHLQYVVTAAAMDICRLYDWLKGDSTHFTPLSQLARLIKEAA
jgi:transposase